MLDHNLVTGFNVNINTPKPDCVACTEAKQSVEPFDQHLKKTTEIGDLTHMDLWGRYDTASITYWWWMILLGMLSEFLKKKSDAVDKVINQRSCLSPPIFHMDSSGLSPQPSLPKSFMIWVEWSGVESTGLDSPLGVHMDYHHCEILLEWTGVQWIQWVQ